MFKKVIIVTFVMICLIGQGPANGYGTTSGNFLKIGVGARPAAMGEAYTALAEGASAAYWNPAGLARQEVFELLSMQANWFYETSFQYLGFSYPFGRLGTFGLSYSLLNYGSVAGYNSLGSREADVGASDNALTLSWGKALNKKISLGLDLKFISETLDTFRASAVGADLGLLLKLPAAFTLGVSLQNQLGELKFIQEQNPLPRKAVIGIAAQNFILEPLTLSADYNLPQGETNYLNYGCEYWFSDFFALRLGSSKSRLQGGIGFKASYFDLDYAYVPYEYLGATHRVSLSLRFAARREEEIKKHFKLGKDYYREQDYLNALSEFNKVLELDPLHKDSREFVDRIVEEMRQKTLQEKVKALREERVKARELLEQAIAEFQKENYDKARELIEESLEIAPKNKEALELKERLDKILKLKRGK